MFIEQAIKKENKFWKYLIGSVFVILASSLAQIPLFLAVFLSQFSATNYQRHS